MGEQLLLQLQSTSPRPHPSTTPAHQPAAVKYFEAEIQTEANLNKHLHNSATEAGAAATQNLEINIAWNRIL